MRTYEFYELKCYNTAMSIYHLSMKLICRAAGRSAVGSAAYRAADVLENERDGVVHDYTARFGVEYVEIVLPEGVSADWARDRSALWNAAEAVEVRKDARTAREIEIALPCELSAVQRLELARSFSAWVADRYQVAVDMAVHRPDEEADQRNHHAHLMLTTRIVGAAGLLGKSHLEWENRKLVSMGLPTTHEQLRAIREQWARMVNEKLIEAGSDARVDHRSLKAQGIELEPTQHVGPAATDLARRGIEVSRSRIDPGSSQINAERILARPELVLEVLTREKSVFSRHDVLRFVHRYVDDRDAYQVAVTKVMASPELVTLTPEVTGPSGRIVEPARYSTREMVDVERMLGVRAEQLSQAGGFTVEQAVVERALAARPFLSVEQRDAVVHLAADNRLAAVVGLAGAGKSALLAAAREAWEGQGYRVVGGALSGKAAEALQTSAGIPSRTLASLELAWERGFDLLDRRTVFVIDEAGMVASKQLGRIVAAAEKAGAKVVMIGDPEQLQPINAGAGFRAVAERVGFTELQEVRRQTVDWQRAASVDFARNRTADALTAYARHGGIRFETDAVAARAAVVREAVADITARPDGTRLVLAHRRADVRQLNEMIRAELRAKGAIGAGIGFRTNDGEREFAGGDRLIFLENNRGLGVKNGQLATVVAAGPGRLVARLDTDAGQGQGAEIAVPVDDYQAFDHGYATTIHKSQGATVDRALVLASRMMDRHLSYVAMTRHREDVQMIAGRDEFADLDALSQGLSRANPKETTLDYSDARPRISASRPPSPASPTPVVQGVDVDDGRLARRSRRSPWLRAEQWVQEWGMRGDDPQAREVLLQRLREDPRMAPFLRNIGNRLGVDLTPALAVLSGFKPEVSGAEGPREESGPGM